MPRARFLRSVLVLASAALLSASRAESQQRPLTLEDYGKWETLGSPTLSPDGGWMAFGLTRNNEANELRVRSLSGDREWVLPFGAAPVFTDDGKWMAYRIQPSPEEAAELRKEEKPIQDALGLLDMTAADTSRVDAVQQFTFSGDGEYLAILKYAPEGAERGVGQTLLVRELAQGTEMHFGNVGEFAWADEGHLLAIVISASGEAGNGVHLFDPSSGNLRVLDSEPTKYTGLTWREDGADLAALKAAPDTLHSDTAFTALAWKGLDGDSPRAFVLTTAGRSDFPDGMAIVPYTDPVWAEDGRTLFVGIQELEPKPEEKPEFTVRDSSTVEIWHARDVDVIPRQQVVDRQLKEENFLTAWHLDDNAIVRLEDELTEEVRLLDGGRLALGLDGTPWELEARFFPGRSDLYRINIRTGEKSAISQGTRYQYTGSAGGKLVYTEEEAIWVYDLANGDRIRIDEQIPTSLVNEVDDHPVLERRPWGVGGWTRGDESVLLYDRYDVWEVATDGSGATRLTRGAEDAVRHRYVRTDPDEETIDLSKPIYFSLFGEWTKNSGYARMGGVGQEVQRLVFEDSSVGSLRKALDAEVFVYRAEAFDDSPDLFVAGADLSQARQVTNTNAFQAEHEWGWTELVEYDNPVSDARLQGILHYPAGYEAGKQYPMIVYYYERVSDGLHRYRVPSERSAYNPTIFTSQGYFVLQPDLTFEKGNPGFSALACVESAVGAVLETGVVDPERIGITGHSWGGYETVFFSTHSDMFSAAIAGSPLTNLVSMYGMMFWNSGFPETNHFQTGQERMEVTLWEDRQAYVGNSPVFDFDKLETPLLMAVGSDDGNVDWHQGIEAYNFARRLDKQFVFLVYRGEGHSNRQEPNQVDYHHRQLEWFGHYLKGEPAPDWIADGVSWIDQEKRRARK